MGKPKMRARSVAMSEKTWERLEIIAKEEGRNVSDVIREASYNLISSRENQKGRPKYDPVTDSYVVNK